MQNRIPIWSSRRFALNSALKKLIPVRLAAWASEAGDKTKPGRIITNEEHDRDGCGGRLGRERSPAAKLPIDTITEALSANQFGHLHRLTTS